MNRVIATVMLLLVLTAAAPPVRAPRRNGRPPLRPPACASPGEIVGPRVAGTNRIGGFLRALIGLDKAGEVTADRLVKPTGLFVSSGTVFIADPGMKAVLRYDEATGRGEWWPRSADIKLLSPVGVAGAPDGRLFILIPS